MLLKIENLTKKFDGLVAVNEVSFEVKQGEILSIIGPNGAGKTSLFNLISGMLSPTSGQIYLDGEKISGKKPHFIARQGIARTFQTTSLFDQLRVVDNLAISYKMQTTSGFWCTLLQSRRWKEDKQNCAKKIGEVLHFIGLTDKADNFVTTLSQEEQKRLAIGIALMGDPKIILLDEPTGGLIQEDTDGLTKLIKNINSLGITICIIEHKMNMIMGLADRIVVLNFGTKICEGTPQEVSSDQAVIKAYLGGDYIA